MHARRAYVSLEEEPGRRAAAKLLTRDEARRIALNVPSVGAGEAVLIDSVIMGAGRF
jgi:hypothetical protein